MTLEAERVINNGVLTFHEAEDQIIQAMQTGCRDTAQAATVSAMRLGMEAWPNNPNLSEACYCLANMAIKHFALFRGETAS